MQPRVGNFDYWVKQTIFLVWKCESIRLHKKTRIILSFIRSQINDEQNKIKFGHFLETGLCVWSRKRSILFSSTTSTRDFLWCHRTYFNQSRTNQFEQIANPVNALLQITFLRNVLWTSKWWIKLKKETNQFREHSQMTSRN